jgi:hypothetical protein
MLTTSLVQSETVHDTVTTRETGRGSKRKGRHHFQPCAKGKDRQSYHVSMCAYQPTIYLQLHRQRYDELLKATVAKVAAKTANVLIGEIVEQGERIWP